MSNINNITSTSNYSAIGQEHLFSELTLEEGAMIEGGATFNLINKSGIGINYTINGLKSFLKPKEDVRYSFSKPPTVLYDKNIGLEEELALANLVEGKNIFNLSGNDLILTPDIIPNVGNT